MEKVARLSIRSDHPVIKDHVVQGTPILPGLAYIDLLVQLAQSAIGVSYRACTLKRVVIYRLLTAPAELEIAFKKEAGAWSITVRGRQPDTLYVTAELHEAPLPLDRRIDARALKQAAVRSRDLDEVYAGARDHGLVHRGIIKAQGTIHVTPAEPLFELRVDEAYREGAKQLLFHPTLLDGAAMAAATLGGESPDGDDLFLPLFYEAFYASEPLQTECLASATMSKRGDLHTLDLAFFDLEGRQIAELKGLTTKRVREQGLMASKREDAPPQPARVEAPPQPERVEIRGAGREAPDLEAVLRNVFAKHLRRPPGDLELDTVFFELGLESAQLLMVVRDLENALSLSLNPTLLFETNSLRDLMGFLRDMLEREPRRAVEPVAVAAPPPVAAVAPVVPVVPVAAAAPVAPVAPAVRLAASSGIDIAVVGMSGRYPRSYDLHAFWKNLEAGLDCITEVPKDRWDWREYHSDDRTKPGHIFSKWGGFIEDHDKFDPMFFNIAPREADAMDPQERLFLEHCWAALEDAGYVREDLQKRGGRYLPGQVGVFAGAMFQEYPLFAAESSVRGERFGLPGGISSITSRVSYFCNFHGPSLAVDTMCSSSLTAIYLACQLLRGGRIDSALAGGVNLTIHPNKYLALSQGHFISSEGQCKSFGVGGDGYIPGEGVGVLYLKRLEDAERDGDHIYGVIKGVAVNHGGKASGYTVPSPRAQGAVIAQALEEAKVDPRTITYVEAHGTGTKLGDPIEIAGLASAFGDGAPKQACRIGSAKSNIGHCESAAGVAGVTKVLLQMKHGKIVPSLHSAELNPNIDFASTPFVVNQELVAWARPVVDGQEQPRRAGVSSFGGSGANAHLVIEEYVPAVRPPAPVQPAIVVLSAKSPDRLQAVAQRLVGWIDQERPTDAQLAEVAYTLQVGREAMDVRLGFIARSMAEVRERLQDFLDGKERADLHRGSVKERRDVLSVFSGDEDVQALLDVWAAKHKHAKILELWVKGLGFDWSKLYTAGTPRRISLPTYPFARDRHWVTQIQAKARIAQAAATVLHPLLHRNTSDLSEQRFSSVFSGAEPFLADHVVAGSRVLPGVASLEMARAAVEQSAGLEGQGQAGVRLKDVVWVRPIAVKDRPASVHIALAPQQSEKGGELAFEVYSKEGERAVHCQGRAELVPVPGRQTLDLSSLRAACAQGRFTADECYGAYRSAGIEYGPAHRGIEEVLVGAGQVLARLSLPPSVAHTQDRYVLHPSLLDSAFQAAVVLMKAETSSRPSLPFALEQVEIFSACTPSMWAYLRPSAGAQPGDKVQKLDIDLCDAEGAICARIRGLSFRVLEGEIQKGVGLALLAPRWTERAAAPAGTRAEIAKHLVLLCGWEPSVAGSVAGRVQASLPGVECLALQADGLDFEAYAAQAFTLIQDILRGKPSGDVLVQVVVSDLLLTGLSGLLQTAERENPRVKGQVILLDAASEPQGLIDAVTANSGVPGERLIQVRDGKRSIREWHEVTPGEDASGLFHRDRGVYLITGGAGGLGLIFAKEIAARASEPTVILTGRSPLDEERRARLAELEGAGARAVYRQVDVADARAVDALLEEVQAEHGSLNGVIHCAGVKRDSFILKKTTQELREVLAAKVAGTLHLDRATQGMRLDYFLLCSSVAGAVGNMGQADYAMGNAFMDSFAAHRNGLVRRGARHGRTLSINWPLWREGGMRVDPETERRMMETTGLVPMETSSGLRALHQGLASGHDQIMALEGDRRALRVPGATPTTPAAAERPAAEARPAAAAGKARPAGGEALLHEKAVRYLKELLSSVIQTSADRIDADAPMEAYGIDSVMIMELTNVLEREFGSLSKTLFFEYQTIEALTGYFVAAHRAKLVALLGGDEAKSEPAPASVQAPAAAAPRAAPALANGISGRQRFADVAPPAKVNGISGHQHFAAVAPPALANGVSGHHHVAAVAPHAADPAVERQGGALDIAIVGVAGRYPQASDVAQFWKNLCEGRDCITEIPRERWDHSKYFDPDKDKLGKTYAKWGGFLDGVDLFDPLFFNISPREAEMMDPQERLFLEVAFETLEGAGYSRDTFTARQRAGLTRNVGVFVGVMYEEYQLYGAQAQLLGEPFATSGNPSSVANRVSYFFDFHGPSMAVDTMCSSSLTAIHLACQSLLRGECEMAIAGGVNVSVHPNKYLLLGQGKFASSKGRCESFGVGGDGYVPGEGAGAVLLKPLDRAIADGDQILGVIKATAINHGGKTNGYTVPNPNAQRTVIQRAYDGAGLNPRAVSYIEAHGTGTSLGDPIEITGLSKAFLPMTQDKQFCAIGSVKSNIGHCESAAGIAGITKVLLQMKHGQLAPSLHSETLNPNIDFTQTPFYVQRGLSEWKRPVLSVDGAAREFPRLAGISSFGAGGSNAHVVIEEYRAEPRAPEHAIDAEHPAWIVLSARNKEQLRELVRRFVDAARDGRLTDAELAGVAYTLQTGRDAMDERLGLTAASVQELQHKLEQYLAGDEGVAGLFRGAAKRDRDQLAQLTANRDVERSFRNGELLALWTKGLAVDWSQLYGAHKPRRVALPTYPFARKRYWVPTLSVQAPAAAATAAPAVAILHPLVHQNTTDLDGIRFSTTFSGREFFLTDHRIKGDGVLPGVAYLEMARAAVHAAAGSMKERKALRLCNIVWARPIVVGEAPVDVQIGLEKRKNGDIVVRVSQDGASVNSQGIAVFRPVQGAPAVELAALRAACSGQMSAAQCYEAFESLGIQYGPAHRAIEAIHLGANEVLARLVLPASVAETLPEFVLHPSLLDAALQASIGLAAGKGNGEGKAMLPFALDQLDVYKNVSPTMWAHIRFSEGSRADAPVAKIDIDLLDDGGTVCVRMKGLSSRALEGTRPHKDPSLAMLVPQWNPSAVRVGAVQPAPTDRLAVVGGTTEQRLRVKRVFPEAQDVELAPGDSIDDITAKLQAQGSIDHVLWIAPEPSGSALLADALIEEHNGGVLLCFRFVKALLGLGFGSRALGWTVITTQAQSVGAHDPVDPTHAGLHGLIGSMAKEYPGWRVRVLDMPRGGEWPLAELFTLPADPQGNARVYRDGRWYEPKLAPMEAAPAGKPVYRRGGVYVVIGGAGGIGEVWSETMIRRYQAQIVWIGRRPQDAAIQAKIDKLSAHGPAPVYLSADAADLERMRWACREIKQRFGQIHGVVHSAIVLLDQSLANMDEGRFRASLSAKVDVTVRMAQAFQGEPLDFALFFSSLNSFTRGPGQSNYVAGCVFKDAFAQALAGEWPCAVKVINWGYWGSVGVVASKAYRERMAQAGIGSIEPAEAMEALETLMSGPASQVAFVKTASAAAPAANTAKKAPGSMISRMRRHLSAQDGNYEHA
ncbi:SDR family NAD(P)-dependent oxidoreductase [Sorangium sp. So ce375]